MRYSLFVAAVGLLTLAGCSNSSTSAARPTDSEIEKAIETRFEAVPSLRADDLDVDADVSKNEITLSGTVESQELRSQAMTIVRDVQPELRIVDKIEVKPREVALTDYTEEMAKTTRERAKSTGDKIGNSLEDAWIHTKLTSKLIGDSDTPAHKINVDVVDNAVTLRGQVESMDAKREAERIARETAGVKRVNNLLTVKG